MRTFTYSAFLRFCVDALAKPLEEKRLAEGIAIPAHLYNNNKKTVATSYNYIWKRISAYRQQILKENKETRLSLNQIIGY
jgi:hypothetical protein